MALPTTLSKPSAPILVRSAWQQLMGLRSSLWPSKGEIAKSGYAMLATWGMISLLAHILMLVLPTRLVIDARFIVWGNSFMWTVVAFATTRKTLRIAFPIILLLLIQIWSIVSHINAVITLGRETVIGKHLFFSVEHMISFFVAAGLVVILPSARRYAANLFLFVVFVSSLVSILQFVKVGPALRLSEIWLEGSSIVGWGGVPGVRASGLTLHPGIAGFAGALAISVVGAKWLYRKANPIDLVVLFVLLAAAVMAQTRSTLPMIGIATLASLLILRRRDIRKANGVTLLMLVGLVAVVFGSAERFGYIFETDWFGGQSFQHRVSNFEPPLRVFADFPLMGVGPDGTMFGSEARVTDRFSTPLVENAYILFAAMFGLPGVIMLVFGFIASALLGAMVYLTAKTENFRKSISLTTFVASVNIILWSLVGGIFQDIPIPPLIFMFVGLTVPLAGEAIRGMPVLRFHRGGLAPVRPVGKPEGSAAAPTP